MEFELTADEISEEHEEHVTNWMQGVLERDFDFDPNTAEELAGMAYAEYCKGDGLTEYECIEKVVNE